MIDICGAIRRGNGVALALGLGCLFGAVSTHAQTSTDFDECGTLVQGAECVLFEGGGGRYFLSDYGRYRAGDAVRVVGGLDTNCTTICTEADGCIRGATVYDPAVYPCGTALPNFPADIISGVCDSVGAGLLGATALGLWFTAPRRRYRRP